MNAPRGVLVAAVTANVLGWFLPAFDDSPGWMAFVAALSPLWSLDEFRNEGVWLLLVVVGSALTNLLFIGLVALLLRGGAAKAVLWSAAAATLLNLHWVIVLDTERRLLQGGYFIWVCSFAVLALAAFLDHRASAPR